MEGAGLEALFHFGQPGAGAFGHVFSQGNEVDRAFFHAPPVALGLPGAVHHFADGLDVKRRPVDGGRGDVRLGAVVRHVAVPAEAALAQLFGRLQHGRRVGVLHEDVRAAVDEGGGRFGFLGRVEPLIDPHDFHAGLGVGAARAQGEAVDVAHDFRDGHGGYHAQRAGFRHGAGQQAGHVSAFVGARVIRAQVGGGFVAGGVLELHLRKVGGHFQHLLHVAEGGAEHQLVALLGHVAQHALGVGAHGHAFHVRGLHLVAKFFFNGFAGVVVRKAPAAVAHGADVGEGDFERLLPGRGGAGGGRGRSGRLLSRLRGGFFFLAAGGKGGGGQRGGGQLERKAFGGMVHGEWKGGRKEEEERGRKGGRKAAIVSKFMIAAP